MYASVINLFWNNVNLTNDVSENKFYNLQRNEVRKIVREAKDDLNLAASRVMGKSIA